MINEKRTIILRNAEFWYPKLDKPVDPFGTLQWELQIRTRDKDQAKSWKDEFFLTVKQEEDDKGVYWKSNLKRKAIKKDGERNTPPDVVNGDKQPIEPMSIGNESTGNVRLFQYPYDMNGRKGTSTMISGVQVVNLKLYVPNSGTDFDIVDVDTDEVESTVDF